MERYMFKSWKYIVNLLFAISMNNHNAELYTYNVPCEVIDNSWCVLLEQTGNQSIFIILWIFNIFVNIIIVTLLVCFAIYVTTIIRSKWLLYFSQFMFQTYTPRECRALLCQFNGNINNATLHLNAVHWCSSKI